MATQAATTAMLFAVTTASKVPKQRTKPPGVFFCSSYFRFFSFLLLLFIFYKKESKLSEFPTTAMPLAVTTASKSGDISGDHRFARLGGADIIAFRISTVRADIRGDHRFARRGSATHLHFISQWKLIFWNLYIFAESSWRLRCSSRLT